MMHESIATLSRLARTSCFAALLLPAGPLLAAAPSGPAASAVVPSTPVPDDPLGRGTPQSSAEKFLSAAQEGDYALAAKYLDLSEIPPDSRSSQGPRLARQLWFILERQATTDFSKLSIDPLGDLSDGLPPNREQLARSDWKSGFDNITLERITDPDGADIWMVSSRSLEHIPDIYEKFRLPLADRLTSEKTEDLLLKVHFMGISVVTWFSIITWMSIWALLFAACLLLARWIIPKMRQGFARRLSSLIHVPVLLLVVTGIIRNMIPERLISAKVTSFFHSNTILIVVVTWTLFRVSDLTARQARARLVERDGSAGFSLIDLMRRVAKCAFVVIALVVWLDNMGFKVTSILASLGVVGLAVGLASKNFLEDLIGAMTLYATDVVNRDEMIAFGSLRGYVEDIGLRMTRIRTLDRSVVTMPNAAFAALQLENFGRRDSFLFNPKLGLRYETSPDQIRYLLIELRKLLYSHPKVIARDVRVRFTSLGAYSLNLDIYCYIRETTYPDFLAVAEDLNLRIMDIVAQAGSGFAFPSQTTYFERGQGIDKDLSQHAEEEVRLQREQGRLFQQGFPDNVIRDLAGTLKYPGSGPDKA